MTSHTTTRRMLLGSAAISLLLISFLVLRFSNAVFSDATTNPGNQVSASNVSITNDHGATALFSVTGVVPNDTITRCITVEYTGTATGADLAAVNLYANTDYNDTTTGSGDFSGELNLTIERDDSFVGSGGTPTDCTGFSSDATLYDGSVAGKTIEGFTDTDAHVDYSSGLAAGWTPSATNETRGFRFVLEFDGAAGADFQDAVLGTTTALGVTWEIQSGSGTAK
jgi:hypothetical protein